MTIKTEDGESNLRVGVRTKDLSIVRAALAEGSDPNEADSHGWTLLHEAVSSGSSSITSALLRQGANLDTQEQLNRNTPLHVASKKGHGKIVQILLDNNANINVKNTDGENAEDVATSTCKELLQRKKIASLMRGGTKSYKQSSLEKLYPKKSSSPTRKQATPGSNDTMTSLGCDGNPQSGPGEIKIVVEYDRRNTWLKINIQKIKDLRLPTDHNYTHIYIKCYLLPDKNKETKGKTSLIKIETHSDDGYSSRGSSASSQNSMASLASTDSDGSQIADKVKSVLKKRPHLHSKKTKDEVKCMLQTDEGDAVGRVSAIIDEGIWYNGLVLRKFNNIMSECKIHLSVCGRNRWTSTGVVIADVTIPVLVALKKTGMPQVFPLDYKIAVCESMDQETQVQVNQSWELKGSEYTGRSLAWNNDLTSESTDAQTNMFKAPSVPDVTSIKKHRKHQSRVSKFLKGDMKLFKGKPNDRYDKNMEVTTQECTISTPVERVSQDEVEYLGQSIPESTSQSVTSKAVMDRQISEHWTNDNMFEITKKLDVTSPPRPSLKYSRAFGEQSVAKSTRNSFFNEAITIEDM